MYYPLSAKDIKRLKRHVYVPINWVTITSANELLTVRHLQDIMWTEDNSLLIEYSRRNSVIFESKCKQLLVLINVCWSSYTPKFQNNSPYLLNHFDFCRSTHTLFASIHTWLNLCLVPAYSLVRACMLDSKGVGWHQAPEWFHLKCMTDCFEETIWCINCLCGVFVCLCIGLFVCFKLDWLSSKLYIMLINIVLKGVWYPALYSDWYPMLLFESLLSSAFWNVLAYSVVRAYSVFHCFSLLCYLELQSTVWWI